jgi:hypothetical protein
MDLNQLIKYYDSNIHQPTKRQIVTKHVILQQIMIRSVIWQNISLNIAVLLAIVTIGCKSGMALEKSLNENKKLREELSQLKSDFRDHEQLAEELKNTKFQLRKTEDALSSFYIQFKSDSVAFQKNDKEINRESKTTLESDRLINNLTSELKTIKEELAQLKKEHLSINEKQNNALLTIKQLSNELSLKNLAIADLNSEMEKLKFQQNEKSTTPQTEEKLIACQNELARIQARTTELEEEKKKILDDLETAKQHNLNEQNNALMDQLQIEIKSKNDKLFILQKNLDSINLEKNKTNLVFEESILIKSKLKEIEKSKEEISKEHESCKNQLNSNAIIIENLKIDRDSYKNEIEILKQNYYKQKDVINKKAIDSLNKIAFREYSKKLNKAIDSIQRINDLNKIKTDKENTRLQSKLNKFENSIKLKESEIHALSTKLISCYTRDSINQTILNKTTPIEQKEEMVQNEVMTEKNKFPSNGTSNFGKNSIKKINEIIKKHNNKISLIANSDLIRISFPHEVLFDSKNIALNQSGSDILLDVIEALSSEKDLIIDINSTINGDKSKFETKEINILRTSTISKLFLAMGIKAQRISFGIDKNSTLQSNSNEQQIIELSFTK